MNNTQAYIEELLAKLWSEDLFEREEAIQQLRGVDDPQVTAALVTVLEDQDKGIRESVSEVLLENPSEITAMLLTQYLAHEDISVRNLASELLVKLGKLALPALFEKAFDDDEDVRKFAIDILGLIADTSAIDVIIKSLNDSNENVVCSAAEALGLLGDPLGVESLIKSYSSARDAHSQILEALGRIGDKRAIELLKKTLEDYDIVVVLTTIEALGNIGTYEAGSILKVLFKKQTDETIRGAIVPALIKIAKNTDCKLSDDIPESQLQPFMQEALAEGDHATKLLVLKEIEDWQKGDTVKVLIDTLQDEDEDIIQYAEKMLSKKISSVTKQISEALTSSPPNVIVQLLKIIAETGEMKFTPDVLKLVDSENEAIRENAAMTLGKIGDVSLLSILETLSQDTVGHVRAAAYKSMGWACGAEATNQLLKGLKDKYSDVRQAALGGLILIGSPRVINHLKEQLNDNDPNQQKIAAQALGWIGEDAVVEPLTIALNHPEWEVRKSAVEALGRINIKSAIEPVRVLLADENPQVRQAAIDSLVCLANKDAITDILILIDDEDHWVKYHAINIVGENGGEETVKKIIPLLSEDDDLIKMAAAKALENLSDQRALPFLKNSLNDTNDDVVNAVTSAIGSLEASQ